MKKTLTLAALLVTTAMPAAALEDGTLLIWTGANRDKEALEAAVAPFVEEYGIDVTVEVVDPDLPQKFQQAASTGDGPDIVMWAHDRFGEWASGGLISPVQPSAAWSEGVLGSALDAVSFDGAVWGYPVSVEAVHLIYNTDLIETPPASFEELIAMEFDGQKILWDYNNTYFTMPLLMANGGFAFQKVDGYYDGSATGVNTDGAIQGAAMLERLIEEGIMPAGVDYGVMDGAMNRGEVGMVLNGPWAWGGLRDSGINFAVAPIPTVDGAESTPFLGVQAFAVNAATPNADLAVELLENFLLTDEGLATWNANGELGALADASAAEAQDDANITKMLNVATNGVPMPSNPEMGAFWAAMGPALTNITTDAQDPEAALNDAAARILGE
ncbi:maltose/maltodextrin ABC transporter substrate-binding protein MalE [Pontivivens insulae]|uniref:Maltodextrin-binding protein n=1 Tax=Pontivivens insulae TaxID=1639689 RepID=A0A2R8AGD6_9RHOB|nr:maltose/maltodextrin ABC transporter substrate-binding protein MalE [Pontivivens insulae]RED10673.1 maltooligosaccharide-binding protein [Pontivivens insulae]SPF31115.1 Maltose-binding periplasmic protein [Pontivivens insulae]